MYNLIIIKKSSFPTIFKEDNIFLTNEELAGLYFTGKVIGIEENLILQIFSSKNNSVESYNKDYLFLNEFEIHGKIYHGKDYSKKTIKELYEELSKGNVTKSKRALFTSGHKAGSTNDVIVIAIQYDTSEFLKGVNLAAKLFEKELVTNIFILN